MSESSYSPFASPVFKWFATIAGTIIAGFTLWTMTTIAITGAEINRKVSVLEVTVPEMKANQENSRTQLASNMVQYQKELKEQLSQLISRPEFESRMSVIQLKQADLDLEIYKLKNPKQL